jgi:hypothetical protein
VSANWSHLSIPANWVTLSALARFMSVTEASSSIPATDYTETPSTLLRFGPWNELGLAHGTVLQFSQVTLLLLPSLHSLHLLQPYFIYIIFDSWQ